MNKAWMAVAALVSSAAFSGAVAASGGGQARLGSRAGGPTAKALVPRLLPPLPKGTGRAKPGAVQAITILDYDDNTCEGGLGANGNQVSSLVEFDPTPPCTAAGPLQILNVTARMNSGNAQEFVYHVPGATPQPVNNASVTQPLSTPITPAGGCPVSGTPGGLQQRVLTTPVSVTPGNAANFFAGIRHTGFAGMDKTPPNANRHWMLCASCGQTQYSPAEINAATTNSVSLGGNRLLRVTVEDVGCTPVELQGFEISD